MKRAAMIFVLLTAVSGASVMAKPAVRRPVSQFIQFYQSSDDMGVWERVVYSVLATRTTGSSSFQ
jgi:hypothetical protein